MPLICASILVGMGKTGAWAERKRAFGQFASYPPSIDCLCLILLIPIKGMESNDISLEAKQELAAKAAECLMEYGAASKFVVINSGFHEVRFRICPSNSLSL